MGEQFEPADAEKALLTFEPDPPSDLYVHNCGEVDSIAKVAFPGLLRVPASLLLSANSQWIS
ncbi:hypothetical protein GCM10027578_28100 [Spirosoma luteolum]